MAQTPAAKTGLPTERLGARLLPLKLRRPLQEQGCPAVPPLVQEHRFLAACGLALPHLNRIEARRAAYQPLPQAAAQRAAEQGVTHPRATPERRGVADERIRCFDMPDHARRQFTLKAGT